MGWNIVKVKVTHQLLKINLIKRGDILKFIFLVLMYV